MNEGQTNPNDLLDTTDCLEAIGVFKGWKNFLFVITICCLLLLQVFFWLVNTGCIKTNDDTNSAASAVVADLPPRLATRVGAAGDAEQINEAAKQVTEDPNQPTKAAPQQPKQQQASPRFGIKFEQLAWLIRFFNFVLILTAVLYCLTMLFSLKVSLLGRLGGINHICRAFFLSLTFLVLLLPWQRFFAGVVVGAMYTPQELSSSYANTEISGIFGAALYYLRFTGYWLVVMLLLIFSYLRSVRWAKTVIRRLEVI